MASGVQKRADDGTQRDHIHSPAAAGYQAAPFHHMKRAAETKAKRHPRARRFMFMREDHAKHNLYNGPVNPERMETEDWEGVTHSIKQTALKMGIPHPRPARLIHF